MRRFATLNVFATEEVRSRWRKGSVHTQPWPESAPLREAAGGEEPALLDSVSQAAISVRRIKSDAKVSQRTPILSVTVRAPQAALPHLEAAISDLTEIGRAHV